MKNTRHPVITNQSPQSVRDYVNLGNYFASNQQWSNTIGAFMQALDLALDLIIKDTQKKGASLGAIPGLSKVLQDLGACTVPASDHVALQKLREAHQKASGFDPEALPFFIRVLPFRDGELWLVIYGDQRVYPLDNTLTVTVPTGTSASFVVSLEGSDAPLSAPLSPAKARQLSYIMAHLGWAWVASAMSLYSHHYVLLDDGIPAIEAAIKYYEDALYLDPANDWALAHLAESYRERANAWPGSTDSLAAPDDRVNNYVCSLILFQAAIAKNPSSWALAHFGAALVNVRAFVGALENPAHAPPALKALLKMWDMKLDSSSRTENDLIDRAILTLMRAMELENNYYPWAQVYYSDALLIKTLILGDTSRNRYGLLGMLNLMSGWYAQPQLISQSTDPGSLFESGFFAPAMVSYWTKQYAVAWQFARLGMGQLFDDYFLPGLPAFFGAQLLVNIALAYIQQTKEERAHDLPDPTILQSEEPSWILKDPISTEEDLVQFIEKVITGMNQPFIQPWLRPEIRLNTNVQVSLIQILFVLLNFSKVLFLLEKIPAARRVAKQAEEISLKLCKKLLYCSTDQDQIPDSLLNYSLSSHDLLMMFSSGKPTHPMASVLAKLKHKHSKQT